MDVFALVMHFKRFAVIALAVTHIAIDIYVGQKVHFDFNDAISLARLTAPALDVKRESSRPIAAFARLGYAGEQLAYGGEQTGVGGGIGARRAADRGLVYINHLVKEFKSAYFSIGRRFGVAAV